MHALNLPYYAFKLKTVGGRLFIFDELRHKYLVLSPEEWVRQHLVKYLILQKNFPPGLISLENGLIFNEMKKRSDIIVHDTNGKLLLLAECKAPGIKLSIKVLEQASRYNQTLEAPLLLLCNGLEMMTFSVNHAQKSIERLQDLPPFT